jgi:hypothetical protein
MDSERELHKMITPLRDSAPSSSLPENGKTIPETAGESSESDEGEFGDNVELF